LARNRTLTASLNLSAQPEGERAVMKAILALIAVGALTACTVRSERTVVERPAPVVTTAPATAVVVADPPASTVIVPR
jgi:hypothetical protein